MKIGHLRQTGNSRPGKPNRVFEWQCEGAGEDWCGNLVWQATSQVKLKKFPMCPECRRQFAHNASNGQGRVRSIDDKRLGAPRKQQISMASWLSRALV